MEKLERILITIALSSLLLAACAPVSQGVSSAVGNISNTIGGVTIVSYQTTAWDLVFGLSQEAMKIQPSSAHTFMSADNLADSSVTLTATPVRGSAATTTIGASDAQEIHVNITTVEKDGYLEVTLSPDPSNDNAARETVAKIIKQLDKMFVRHTGA